MKLTSDCRAAVSGCSGLQMAARAPCHVSVARTGQARRRRARRPRLQPARGQARVRAAAGGGGRLRHVQGRAQGRPALQQPRQRVRLRVLPLPRTGMGTGAMSCTVRIPFVLCSTPPSTAALRAVSLSRAARYSGVELEPARSIRPTPLTHTANPHLTTPRSFRPPSTGCPPRAVLQPPRHGRSQPAAAAAATPGPRRTEANGRTRRHQSPAGPAHATCRARPPPGGCSSQRLGRGLGLSGSGCGRGGGRPVAEGHEHGGVRLCGGLRRWERDGGRGGGRGGWDGHGGLQTVVWIAAATAAATGGGSYGRWALWWTIYLLRAVQLDPVSKLVLAICQL